MNNLSGHGIMRTLYMYALMMNPLLGFESMPKFRECKPDYYKVNLSKEERRGKTPEEIQELRKKKYEEMQQRGEE